MSSFSTTAGLETLRTTLEQSEEAQESFDCATDLATVQEKIIDATDVTTDIKAAAMWVLVRLCRREMPKSTANEKNLDAVGSDENIQALFGALKDHQELFTDSEMALSTSWLMMVLASDSVPRQESLAKHGALDVLYCILNNFKESTDHPKVSEFVLRACRNLASNGDVANQMIKFNVCECIVEVIRRHNTAINLGEGDLAIPSQQGFEVLEACMWAALNLTSEEDIAKIFSSQQGCDVVIESINIISAHGEAKLSDADADDNNKQANATATAACSVLRNLTCTGTYNFSLLLHTSVCETVLRVMAAFPDCFDVNETSLWIIMNLSSEKNMAARLMQLDIHKVLTSTASALSLNYRVLPEEEETTAVRHSYTGPIAEAIIWCTKHFCAVSKEYALEFGNAGMIDVFAGFMKEYKKRDGIVHAICDCEAMLTFTIRQTEEERSIPIMKNVMKVILSGTPQIIIDTLEIHSGQIAAQLSDLHEPAMLLFAKCIEETIRFTTQWQGEGSENDIEIARVEGVTEAEVVDARAVLKELQRRTRGENIFAIVLLTMKEHPQNGDLARCCCQILLDLYYTSAEDKNALLEKGLIHEPTGKAIVGGNTLDEVFQKWNTEEVSIRSKI